jgi:ubiquinone/menaquinone biosynthesis C-methylase UbiE
MKFLHISFKIGSKIICLDKNYYFERELLQNFNKTCDEKIDLKDTLVAYAENMSYLRNNSVNYVLCTFSLSCVEDIQQVLNEIYRILKPNGQLIFLDRIENRSNSLIAFIQQRLNPICKFLFDYGISSNVDFHLYKSKLRVCQFEYFELKDSWWRINHSFVKGIAFKKVL